MKRSTSPKRAWAVGTSAALLLTLTGGAATAQSFLDPADPCPPGVDVEPADFDDRDQISAVHVLNVDCGVALDVVHGRADGSFHPSGMTRRDQMAAFILRGLEAAGYDLPAPRDQGFEDIEGNTHEDAINVLAQIGVTHGKTPTRYAPSEFVRRDQMASFMLRAAAFAFEDEAGFKPVTSGTFSDVSAANVHRASIEAASDLLGLATGKTDGRFDPAGFTRRDQMATFIVRLIDMTLTEGGAGEVSDSSTAGLPGTLDAVLGRLNE